MTYLEYTFSGFKDDNTSEILIALLDDAGYSGFLESEYHLKAYINTADQNEILLNELLDELEVHSGKIEFSRAEIPETNWNAKWESEFVPVRLGEEVYIRAPFHPTDQGSKYEIIIEPKMSFGTGHHETTRLMVQSMLTINLASKKVLDMGCGTGVLAILASKMACTSVLGIDIDDWACRNSAENAAMNHCDNISIRQGDISALAGMKFQVILANINRNVLLTEMAEYNNALLAEGILIISGILVQDREMIMDEAARCNLIFKEFREENKWLSIIFKKEALY